MGQWGFWRWPGGRGGRRGGERGRLWRGWWRNDRGRTKLWGCDPVKPRQLASPETANAPAVQRGAFAAPGEPRSTRFWGPPPRPLTASAPASRPCRMDVWGAVQASKWLCNFRFASSFSDILVHFWLGAQSPSYTPIGEDPLMMSCWWHRRLSSKPVLCSLSLKKISQKVIFNHFHPMVSW